MKLPLLKSSYKVQFIESVVKELLDSALSSGNMRRMQEIMEKKNIYISFTYGNLWTNGTYFFKFT